MCSPAMLTMMIAGLVATIELPRAVMCGPMVPAVPKMLVYTPISLVGSQMIGKATATMRKIAF